MARNKDSSSHSSFHDHTTIPHLNPSSPTRSNSLNLLAEMASQNPKKVPGNVVGPSSSSISKPIAILENAPNSLIGVIIKQLVESNPPVLPDVFVGSRQINLNDYVDLTIVPLATHQTLKLKLKTLPLTIL